jgi:CheY-like chemotaxis protein
MDLQMPSMSGLETTTAIRSVPGYADVPIIAVTANSSEEHRVLCREYGMQGFIAKPIQSEELLSTLARVLVAA